MKIPKHCANLLLGQNLMCHYHYTIVAHLFINLNFITWIITYYEK